MRSGITNRWLRGSLFLTVLLVLLVESMFVYNFGRSYYNSVQQTMMRRFSRRPRPTAVWPCAGWWSSLRIKTNMSSCCWTATAA